MLAWGSGSASVKCWIRIRIEVKIQASEAPSGAVDAQNGSLETQRSPKGSIDQVVADFHHTDEQKPDPQKWKFRSFRRLIQLWTLKMDSCARIYRPSFHENNIVFSNRKRAFWGCFRESWVYKFGHWRVYRPVVADSHHPDEDPDPHISEKLDPDPHWSDEDPQPWLNEFRVR
jgi:hypothetical protein